VPDGGYRYEDRPDGVSTLRHYLNVLWRGKWIGLAAVVLIAAVALLGALRQQSLYEVSADVLINRQEVATTSVIGQTPALDDAGRTMETQVRLAKVPAVLERTIADAGVSGLSASGLSGQSSVFPLADILRFSVSDHDAGRAASLASAYARAFVRYRRELDTSGLARTLEQLASQMDQLQAAGSGDSALYLRLADRQQQLETLRTLRSSNVSVVRTAGAADADKVAPRPLRTVAIALVIGLVVGLILVFLRETLSTRPRDENEVEALLGMPFLGRIRLGGYADVWRSSAGSAGDDGDAIHRLRTNLELANARLGARTIMVTSPGWGEGKSETTAQLGAALARAGHRVTLVDLDMRRSSLSRLLALDDRLGLSAVLRGECDLNEAVVSLSTGNRPERGVLSRTNGRPNGSPLLEAVAAGAIDGHPAEVLSSKALAELLIEVREATDIVLVDVPPLLEAPDAAALISRMDAMLLVMSSAHARGPTLADVRRATDTWNAAKLGFALTEGKEAPVSRSPSSRVTESPTTSASERDRIA
jgi:Mrp family chromosome partitioning ATPase/capsular polysaccharide biosynthesis protein